MNNQGKLNSLLKIGAAGAAIYGISKGLRNGTIQKIPQQVSNATQNVLNNQNSQQGTNQLQSMSNQNSYNTNQNKQSNLQQPTEMYAPLGSVPNTNGLDPENIPENGC